MIKANWRIPEGWSVIPDQELILELGCEVTFFDGVLIEFVGTREDYLRLVPLLGAGTVSRVPVVNCSSWHYRLMAKVGQVPESVCLYFWTLIFRVFLITVGAVLIGGMGVLILNHYVPQGSLWWVIPVGILIVPAGILLITLIAALVGYFSERGSESVVGEYIRAKKEKVCPRIHFK